MDKDAPETAEGVAAWAACKSEGVWRYSGVVGPGGGMMICTGLDFAAAGRLADAGGDLDPDALNVCLRAIESGRLLGQAAQAETES